MTRVRTPAAVPSLRRPTGHRGRFRFLPAWPYTRLGRAVGHVVGTCLALAVMALAVVLLVAVIVGAVVAVEWMWSAL